MVLPDVNVLVSAYRTDATAHDVCRAWLESTVRGAEAFAIADLVLSGFLRIVTHPAVFALPTPVDQALEFARAIRAQPHCTPVAPGARHWSIFEKLCRDADARGNLVADAYLAALAIESGSEWVTLDRDYARFAGLRWSPPRS